MTFKIFSTRENKEVDWHLSASQLDTWAVCQPQWFNRYIEGIIIPPGIALHVGSSLHEAAGKNFTEKIVSGEDLPLDVVMDAARDEFMNAIRDKGVFLSREEAQAKSRLLGAALDQTVGLARCMREDFAPSVVMPTAVERELRWNDPEVGIEWLGYVDLIEDITLHELKTSKTRWSEKKVDASTQLALYPALIERIDGARPAQVSADVFVKTKTPDFQQLWSQHDESDFEIIRRRGEAMIKGVESGIIYPCDPGHWKCDPAYCGYWGSCGWVSDRRRRLPNR